MPNYFYFIPELFPIGLSLLLLTIILYLIATFYHATNPATPKLSIFYHVLLVLYLFYHLWLLATFEYFSYQGLLSIPRPALGVPVVLLILLAGVLSFQTKHRYYLGHIFWLTCQLISAVSFPRFITAYFIIWLGWGLLGLAFLNHCYLVSGRQITSLSIKQAIDHLPYGLSYAHQNGQIFLTNNFLYHLLSDKLAIKQNNIHQVWAALAVSTGNPSASANTGSQQIQIADRSYAFRLDCLKTKAKTFYTLTAEDITDKLQLAQQIKDDNVRLDNIAHSLKAAIQSIEATEKNQVLIQSKMKLHNVFAQKISLIHYFLTSSRHNQSQALSQITPILADLKHELYADLISSPAQIKNNLLLSLDKLGVSYSFCGQLPTDLSAHLLIEIMREATTNAIRHGNASHLDFELISNSAFHRLVITNDGYCPIESPTKGNGLTAIEDRLQQLGGHLQIESKPQFKLIASIPIPKNPLF